VIVRWTRRALADLDRIATYIAADNPGAAQALVSSLRAKSLHLAQHPLMGRTGVVGDTRELVVHRNYLLTDRVRRDEVQVLQVWHAAQRRSGE
jgi:toxin ParE1/3/4